MRTIRLETYLQADPDLVWDHVNRPALLLHVSAPLIRFSPLRPATFPERWAEAEYLVGMRLWGVLPMGRQAIRISRPEPQGDERLLLDDGSSRMIRRWHHLIRIAPEGQGTRYSDLVEIEAGALTPMVAAFARRFYAHRQSRWRDLVAAGFDYDA